MYSEYIKNNIEKISEYKNTYNTLSYCEKSDINTYYRDKHTNKELIEKGVKVCIISSPETYPKVAGIHIPSFYIDLNAAYNGDSDYRSSSRDVRDALIDINRNNVDGLILDLRNNPGGLVTEMIKISDDLIDKGPILQVSNDGAIDVLEVESEGQLFHSPMIVLIDNTSGPAAEYLAAILQDYRRAISIGNRTSGCGGITHISGVEASSKVSVYRISGVPITIVDPKNETPG